MEPTDLKWLLIYIIVNVHVCLHSTYMEKERGTGISQYKLEDSVGVEHFQRKQFCQWFITHRVTNSPDVVGQNRSQAHFRKPLCIFRGNKCGLEGSHYHRSRLVRVSLSYSLATVETPQDRKMGSGMTACSKLRYPNKLLRNMLIVIEHVPFLHSSKTSKQVCSIN